MSRRLVARGPDHADGEVGPHAFEHGARCDAVERDLRNDLSHADANTVRRRERDPTVAQREPMTAHYSHVDVNEKAAAVATVLQLVRAPKKSDAPAAATDCGGTFGGSPEPKSESAR